MSEQNRYALPPHVDGVFWEDGCWKAYLDGGALIACGPDKPIIKAAYEWHRGQRAQIGADGE